MPHAADAAAAAYAAADALRAEMLTRCHDTLLLLLSLLMLFSAAAACRRRQRTPAPTLPRAHAPFSLIFTLLYRRQAGDGALAMSAMLRYDADAVCCCCY